METQTSWLADGVKSIEALTRKSMIVEPKIISIDKEKPGTYGIVTPGPAGTPNTIDIRVAEPLWHNERLASPLQMKQFIKSMSDRSVLPEDGAVYISEQSITYVFSFEDRRHRAVCPLVTRKPWDWLTNNSVTPQALSQREIVRLLRIVFDRCLPTDSNLVSTLRKVVWKADGSVEGNLQRGKEGLGRQIMNEVLGITDFPEEFSLNVNVFESYEHSVTVRVALEILPDAQRFEIIPFPSEIRRGMDDTLNWLLADIAETGVPTFIGAVTAGKDQG